ncbi:outer membrane protein [Photobacterium sp. DNB23_23_1]|uniref:Porin family protein n=1 Tax=Photobacterium pectinilyticum TaxID=2906793 RepID=A0ABT1N630_9GAMM|nr:outer membrane beta-barrel protein [Photobacterium sp. ZSDE20]MCQ1060190.1 porin family protein [Photobacterium sp. ZSDE20]MDD1827649.1 porin family protein [Photobacterium sp. ZSDE20]
MKKLMLLPLATLVSGSFAANAQEPMTQNFDYISGGLQISKFNKDLWSEANANTGILATTDGGAGLYLRGSWNFADNFFVETRGDAIAADDMIFSNGLLGLGYFMPINNDFTVYGLAGFANSRYDLDVKTPFGTFGGNETQSGFTGEIGARYQVMDRWMVEPAVRFATYDDTMYELRLGNSVKMTEHVSLEANLSRNDYDAFAETNVQLGARYSF